MRTTPPSGMGSIAPHQVFTPSSRSHSDPTGSIGPPESSEPPSDELASAESADEVASLESPADVEPSLVGSPSPTFSGGGSQPAGNKETSSAPLRASEEE
jgi:hypothetical protein